MCKHSAAVRLQCHLLLALPCFASSAAPPDSNMLLSEGCVYIYCLSAMEKKKEKKNGTLITTTEESVGSVRTGSRSLGGPLAPPSVFPVSHTSSSPKGRTGAAPGGPRDTHRFRGSRRHLHCL